MHTYGTELLLISISICEFVGLGEFSVTWFHFHPCLSAFEFLVKFSATEWIVALWPFVDFSHQSQQRSR